MFWTTEWEGRFMDRHQAVLESYLYHHPEMAVDVYYLIDDQKLMNLKESMLSVNFRPMDEQLFQELSMKCPFGEWLRLDKGKHYHSHLTDFLRFCLLYLHGGLYSDFDALLLRPLNDILSSSNAKDKLVVGKDEIGKGEQCDWCLGAGRHYAAPGLMIAMKSGLEILRTAMKNAFSDYQPNVFGWAGPQAITKAIKMDKLHKRQVLLLDVGIFYPVNWMSAWRLFEQDSIQTSLWTMINKGQAKSLHFYGSTTKNLPIQSQSIMELLTNNEKAIRCFGDYWDLASTDYTIGPLLFIRKGDRVELSAKHDGLSDTTIEGSISDINRRLKATQYLNKTTATDTLIVQVFEGIEMLEKVEIPIINIKLAVTIVSKTFGRMSKVFNLVDSIRAQYPDVTILIGDDGPEAVQTRLDTNKFTFVAFEYDIGLSEGRNRLLEMVKTEYVIFLDDDFVFTSESDIAKLTLLASSTGSDIVGAKSPKDVSQFQFDYCGLMHVSRRKQRLHLTNGRKGVIQGCSMVDYVPNLFVSRVSSLKKVKWDPKLKLGEHEDFFLRAKRARLRVLSCPQIAFEHQQSKFWENKTHYDKMRLRVFSFMTDALKKHNLTELRTQGRIVMRLMDISESPIHRIQVETISPNEAALKVFPDKDYYRFKISIDNTFIDDIYNSHSIQISDLEPGVNHKVNIWAGNHTDFSSNPASVVFETPSQDDNLLTNGSFDNVLQASFWKSSIATPFQLIKTVRLQSPFDSQLLIGRSDGYALGISIVNSQPLSLQYNRFNQHYHSVYQVVNVSRLKKCPNGGRLVLSGWSLPGRFYSEISEGLSSPPLGYRLQIEASLQDGRFLYAHSPDFDFLKSKWHSRTAVIDLNAGDHVKDITVRMVLDATRANAFFDDLVLGMLCK